MDDYQGVTHHPAPEKLIRATWRGVYVVKELTDTTCEWTWAAQVDLKVPAMPTSMLDFLTKKELTWAGTVQEKYSRNRKKVDREKVDSLAKDMRRRRGEPLMEDQVRSGVLFSSISLSQPLTHARYASFIRHHRLRYSKAANNC